MGGGAWLAVSSLAVGKLAEVCCVNAEQQSSANL